MRTIKIAHGRKSKLEFPLLSHGKYQDNHRICGINKWEIKKMTAAVVSDFKLLLSSPW